MNLNIITQNKVTLAELISDKIEISTLQDSLDLIGNAHYLGASGAVICEGQLSPDFFDLKTRLAGEILQKFANYHFRLSIVGDFSKYESNALNAFIIECNRGSHISFVDNRELALVTISGSPA